MRAVWDAFVRESRCATFLFMRDYMDYHADRFTDCSWMAYKGNRLMALLPANITTTKSGTSTLHSHQGLTYGGWLLPQAHLDGADLIELWQRALEVWKERGVSALDYKPLPGIYCAQPSEEDRYALFRLGARLTECNLSEAVNLQAPWRFNTLQRRHLAKASKLDYDFIELGPSEVGAYMTMLSDCLAERHGASPVHSAAELTMLMDRFPENIRIFAVGHEGALHAGVCVYDTGRVAHAQYIATTPRGRELNLLTPLFHRLMTDTYAERAYFDFGISNEDSGRYLNEGLLRQKFSYGATGVAYTRWLLSF